MRDWLQMKLWFRRLTVSQQNSAASTTVVLTSRSAATESMTVRMGPTSSTVVHKSFLCKLPLTKEEVNAFARVCLSVCLSVSKITQKRVHGFG